MGYQGGRTPTGWPHTAQSGDPDCRGPEAEPHQRDTPKLTCTVIVAAVPCPLCSVWYELAYIESRQGVSRGGRVWQLAFGSGFKFNSNVMVANRKGEGATRGRACSGVA